MPDCKLGMSTSDTVERISLGLDRCKMFLQMTDLLSAGLILSMYHSTRAKQALFEEGRARASKSPAKLLLLRFFPPRGVTLFI